MPTKNKKSANEARTRLENKLQEVKTKTKFLHDFIDNISNEAILHAEKSLKETSKSKFLNGYSKASEQLESCLSKFLLISDALETMNDSTDEEDTEDDDEADEKETFISDTTAVAEDSAFVSTIVSTINETICTTADERPEITPVVRRRSNSQESLFSSVSMQLHSTLKPSHSPVMLTKDVTVERYQWKGGVAYPVLITNFISPWEFYVQLVNPQNDVMEQMCIAFMKQATCGYKGGIDVQPEIGMFCCAKSDDNTWYRARIVDICKDNSPHGWTAKVFFIDEGFFNEVDQTCLRPLDKKYANLLPCQAFHCILGGVQPIDALRHQDKATLSFNKCSELWSDESIAWFKEKMDLGMFDAYFNLPPKSAYTDPHLLDQNILVCDLYIHLPNNKSKLWQFSYERPDLELHLGYKLIALKMSAHCGYFESELNRDASQRIMKEKLYLKTEVEKKDKAEASSIQLQKTHYTQATKEKKEQLPSHNCQKNLKKEDQQLKKEEKPQPKTKQNKRVEDNKRSPKKSDNRKKKNRKESQRRNSYASDSNSNTSSNTTISPNNKSEVKLKIDSTPMQIEFVSDAKNVPKSQSPQPILVKSPSPQPTISPSSDVFQSPGPSSPVDGNIPNVIAVEERTSNFKFGQTFSEIKLAVKKDTFLKVVVSEVVNPGLFYIHLVSPEVAKLDDMMDNLNAFYNMKVDDIREEARSFLIEEGVAVIAKFTPDNRWYRGLVVSKDDDTEDKYNVLYVDFGNSDVVSVHDILPVCEEFCELPMETIACCLADIDPLSPLISSEKTTVIPAGDESSEEEGVIITEIKTSPRNSYNSLSRWSEKCINAFKNIVLTEFPLLVALKTCEKNTNGLYSVYLYDTANDHDLFINQHLVDEGIATSKVFSKKTPSIQTNELTPEQGQMEKWNPMEEQFYSKRNAYSVDEDNPAVAMLGYVEKEKEICHQFLRGRCPRGSGCRFAHVKPGERPDAYHEVFCTDNIIQLPELGNWVPVTVTALLDPSHFWVNFPCGVELFSDSKKLKEDEGDSLVRLNEAMNEFYSHLKRNDKTDLTILAEGEVIAAKYQGNWYRARVVNAAEDLVQVFFVDYGNTSVMNEDDIRKLIPDFLHLPLQAVECRLNGVEIEDDLKQSNLIMYTELRLKFQKLTADKLLMALIVARSPRKELILDLYDTSTNPHTYINQLVSTWNGMTVFKKVPNNVRKGSNSKKPMVTMYPG